MRVQRVPDGFYGRRNPMETVMRKFTTLFLLALAMTIGANQSFAQQAAGPNDTGKIDRPDRPDRDDDDDGGDRDDPLTPSKLTIFIPCSLTHGFGCDRPPRPRKPKLVVVEKETEECGCQHKVMRVGGRFVTVLDCYQSIEVNGREQLRYCPKDG